MEGLDLNKILDEERRKLEHQVFLKFRKIKKLYEAKEFKNALKQIYSLLDSQKLADCENLYLFAALCHSSLNEHHNAIEMCRKKLMKNLKKFEFWYLYGYLHALASNFDESHKAFTQADQRDTKNIKKQFYIDWIFVSYQRNDIQALKYAISSLINIDSMNQFAYSCLILMYFKQNNLEPTTKIVDILLKHTVNMLENVSQPHIIRIYILNLIRLKVYILKKIKRFDDILKLVHEYQTNDFQIPMALNHQWKSLAYLGINDHKNAKIHCEKLLKINPDNIDTIEMYLKILQNIDDEKNGINKKSRTHLLSIIIDNFSDSNLAKSIFVVELDLEWCQESEIQKFDSILREMIISKSFGFFESLSDTFLKNDKKYHILRLHLDDQRNISKEIELFRYQLLLRYSQLGKTSKKDLLKSICDIEEFLKNNKFNLDDYNFTNSLISSANNKLDLIDKSYSISMETFTNERTSKYFAMKLIKYSLINGYFDKHIETLKLFSDPKEDDIINYHNKFHFIKYAKYLTYFFVMKCDYKKVFNICQLHIHGCFQFKKDLYDSLLFCCNRRTILSIHEAHDSYHLIFKPHATYMIAALGLKISMASMKYPEKFPLDTKEPTEKLAKKFLLSLFISNMFPNLTHRLAIEFYNMKGNKIALLRSFKLLKCSKEMHSQILSRYSINLSDLDEFVAPNNELCELLSDTMISNDTNVNIDKNHVWLLNEPFKNEIKLQNEILESDHIESEKCLPYHENLKNLIRFNKFLNIIY